MCMCVHACVSLLLDVCMSQQIFLWKALFFTVKFRRERLRDWVFSNTTRFTSALWMLRTVTCCTVHETDVLSTALSCPVAYRSVHERLYACDDFAMVGIVRTEILTFLHKGHEHGEFRPAIVFGPWLPALTLLPFYCINRSIVYLHFYVVLNFSQCLHGIAVASTDFASCTHTNMPSH